MFHDLIFWQKHSGILPNKCCKNWHTETEISLDMKLLRQERETREQQR